MQTKRRSGVSDAAAPKTTRVNVRIDAEAQRRLAVHCAMTGLSPGEVISRLIHGLKEWSMPVNLVARASQRVSAEISAPVSVSETQHALADAA